MKYNKKNIMTQAHEFYRDGRFADTFSECLRMAWESARKVVLVREAIAVESHTYGGWLELGYEVIHNEHAVAQVEVYKALKTKTTTKLSFFTREQVCESGSQPYGVA